MLTYLRVNRSYKNIFIGLAFSRQLFITFDVLVSFCCDKHSNDYEQAVNDVENIRDLLIRTDLSN